MPYNEIPTDETVVKELHRLQHGPERVTASMLCDALVQENYPRRDSQLAIQRAIERGRIVVAADWTLSAANMVVAA